MVFGLTGASRAAQEGFDGWDLEPSVSQAHLVVVARVVNISSLTVVEGAKTDVALREYRFQSVRRLKGIFQRDQLAMTNADLGCPAEDPVLGCPLKEGEFRLLILVQQQGLQNMGCVSASPGTTTFAERVPLLSGPEDPLVATVETLIKVTDARSRRERAKLLVDRLHTTDGLAAVPLLTSLQTRADWAAADPRALPVLAQLTARQPPAVCAAALKALRNALANYHTSGGGFDWQVVVDALHDALTVQPFEGCNPRHAIRTVDRVAAIDALGYLRARNIVIPWADDWLIGQLTKAGTHAEQTAAATALSRSKSPAAIAAVNDALARLPLDELPAYETAYARAAERLSWTQAERSLIERLNHSIIAQQSLEAEMEPLGRRRSTASLAYLLHAAHQDELSPADRYHLARALGQLRDDQAVPVLMRWMRDDDHRLRELALTALENIDSPLAARETRPLLKTEPNLANKLRMARLLARHQIADGYALATEHLADRTHTPQALLVLVALNDPRTTNELSEIVAARPDRHWYAVTLGALAAIGNAEAKAQLLAILNDDRHPLLADAVEAAGLVDADEYLLPLAKLAQSRNKHIALASLVAIHRNLSDVRSSPSGIAAAQTGHFFAEDEMLDEPRAAGRLIPPVIEAPAIFDAVAALAIDTYVEPDVRRLAIAVARLLHTNRYGELLERLADQAELEGTPLLKIIQAARLAWRDARDGC
ncbi:MAG TPA: HEAT repeat domain-containing protein [Pirellulales bacterium]|jgi:hypothetical protein